MKPFAQPIGPNDIGDLIDLSVAGEAETRTMAQRQLEGVAALYNILCTQPFAYLADEVGMGKTYQALALAAVLWNEKPRARVLFISPRHNLQVQWVDDYNRFFATNYRRNQGMGDDVVSSVLFNTPIHRAVAFDNLRTWSTTLGMREPIVPFLRHTSFTRPVYVTGRDFDTKGGAWGRAKATLHRASLFEFERPPRVARSNASEVLNGVFATALNRKLAALGGGEPYFDLVVVDEAQCLRRPENQRNTVLFTALRGQVRKWLFMSATPAHSGPDDIPRIVNHYPCAGVRLDDSLTQDLPAMQRALQSFLVRRPRRYEAGAARVQVDKSCYRRHDRESWAVRDEDMSVLGTLAMGLVQKGLVEVLRGRNNRYRVGFLSSFESLQSSLNHAHVDDEEGTDFYASKNARVDEHDAPDSMFIDTLARDFERRFDRPLPHPKVDAVVDRVARRAFGDDEEVGGEKFLVFTRRISTVHTLRRQLAERNLRAIERRVRRCWNDVLDWSGGRANIHGLAQEDEDDAAAYEADSNEDRLGEAMAKGGWLYRFRQTFRSMNGNAMFFEDGWLRRLCRAGGVPVDEAARRIPDFLWAESRTHAMRGGAKQRKHQPARARYLAIWALTLEPEVFGLDDRSAKPWRLAYEDILHEQLERAPPAPTVDRDPSLFEDTLWTLWDAHFGPGSPLALPTADPGCVDGDHRAQLCKRQVVRTLLGQTFRLTDTLIDLYYAGLQPGGDRAQVFLHWLESDDPAARRLRRDCKHWIAHTRLIVDNCLEGAGRKWHELARVEDWKQLYNRKAVLGITGGSGAHLTATRQFRTPSAPQVIVCTDALKEGVNLHLFCDRVLHYGVAWTSGDLEQRVGRVDRFFSQIERRLRHGESPAAQLEVGYPHVASSLERGQVDRVVRRQKLAENLMDSPLSSARRGPGEVVVGSTAAEEDPQQLDPYAPPRLAPRVRDVACMSLADTAAIRDHYATWFRELCDALKQGEWTVNAGEELARAFTISGSGRQRSVEWSFAPTLQRYLLTIAASRRADDDEGFSGGSRRRGNPRVVERFSRVLVPTFDEGLDHDAIARVVSVLRDETPTPSPKAQGVWGPALERAHARDVRWSEHKAMAVVPRDDCDREHRVSLYAYEGGVRIVGIVAAADEIEFEASRRGTKRSLREWALDETNELSWGYLDVHPRDGLVFGTHVMHGQLSVAARRDLVQAVAWGADVWEATCSREDRH